MDILFEVTSLLCYLVYLRIGHIEQVYRIFGCLKSYTNAWLVMDLTYIHIAEDRFEKTKWEDFYPDARDKLPPGMPHPREKEVHMACFVDADHAGDKSSLGDLAWEL